MIINSLLDTDLYKLSMQQVVFNKFSDVTAEAKLIVRSEIGLDFLVKKIESEIDHLCTLTFAHGEIEYLKTLPYFKKGYLNYLETFQLKRDCIKVIEKNGQIDIHLNGLWKDIILFEVPVLAIIEELYCKSVIESENIDYIKIGKTNLENKISFINANPFSLIEFGSRRRISLAWQDYMVSQLKEKVPTFLGTSNVYLAKKHNVKVFGSQAHEFIMAGQGLFNNDLINSQKRMLDIWIEEYGDKLSIALTDTIGIDAFLKDFDYHRASAFQGVRHDSSDPIEWGRKMINHYNNMNMDPKKKNLLFSDNLNFVKANEINKEFGEQAKVSFGIGTFLSNDNGMKPLSIVLKLTSIDGCPVAKISDEQGKETCDSPEFLHKLKKVFGKA